MPTATGWSYSNKIIIKKFLFEAILFRRSRIKRPKEALLKTLERSDFLIGALGRLSLYPLLPSSFPGALGRLSPPFVPFCLVPLCLCALAPANSSGAPAPFH